MHQQKTKTYAFPSEKLQNKVIASFNAPATTAETTKLTVVCSCALSEVVDQTHLFRAVN